MTDSQTTSEVPMLSDEQIEDLWKTWVGAGRANYSFSRAIEQAVRAQWTAEVAKVYELLHRTEDEKMALKAERDAAQAEAARFREALAIYADAGFYHGCSFVFDRPTGGFDEDFEFNADYQRAMPGKSARAVLQPREGEQA